MDQAYRKNLALKKCAKVFKGVIEELDCIEPDKDKRQLMTLQYFTCLHAKICHPRSTKNARDIVCADQQQTNKKNHSIYKL